MPSIPVAGADRLVLTEHIAVMDLMALADCLLLPDDDLALASVLKSPLFGLSEEQLFDLAFDRKGSLRASLRDKPDFAATNGALDELANAARALTPFGFFAHVLGANRGRAKFLARLGPEANDALDEFLNLALDYETARDAVAAGLRRLAARGAKRGEARHGDGARRGARDDRARRQGAGSAHGHSWPTPPRRRPARAIRACSLWKMARWSGRPRAATTSAPWAMRAARRSRPRATNIAACSMSR